MNDADIDLAILAAQTTPVRMTFTTMGALAPFTLASAVSKLWERGFDTPLIIMNPWRIKDIVSWGEEGVPLNLRFRSIRPREWKHTGTLRGWFLDCEVHAHPDIDRDEIVIISDCDECEASSKILIV